MADTWVFDGSNWTQALPPVSPTPRSGDANLMTYVPANNGLILFGGTTGGSNTFDDTWLWNGTTWTQLSPPNSPPASFSPSLVYDAASSTAVLFRFEGETWTWDGQNWQQAAALSPPSRFGSVYAYDAAVGKVLMYSGANCLPQFDDEYLWNGISWSQVDLGDRFPPQRTYSQMSFDAARDQAVLFSGVRDGCSFLRDTWTWNGASWTWLHPQTNPPSRAWSSMAYDRQHNVSVLFGGRGGDSADRNDTWVFDGARWIPKSPLTSPSAREGAVMAFDSATGKILLFGGLSIVTAAGTTTTTVGTARTGHRNSRLQHHRGASILICHTTIKADPLSLAGRFSQEQSSRILGDGMAPIAFGNHCRLLDHRRGMPPLLIWMQLVRASFFLVVKELLIFLPTCGHLTVRHGSR